MTLAIKVSFTKFEYLSSDRFLDKSIAVGIDQADEV
jgi:hypothetical protein